MSSERLNNGRTVRLACRYRVGIAQDIPKLEWFGAFTLHRQIIRQAFAAQVSGAGLVFVADANDFPIAQVWVRFSRSGPPRLWAFRVMPPFQGLGLGRGLLRFAEHDLARRNMTACEIGVEKGNLEARQLYERLGYQFAYEQIEQYSFLTPGGDRRTGTADQWVLRKSLQLSGPDIQLTSTTRAAAEDRRADKAPLDEPSSAQAAARSPASHSKARAIPAYSVRRSVPQSARVRGCADRTANRS
jgi:GNAT superfamily N-acetyltransferase